MEWLQPRSVVDLGCGIGSWLRAFMENGVEDVMGFDGPWAPIDRLLIPEARFRHADLGKPVRCPRRFDLAVSLEAAEHLAPSCADDLIESLTSLADVCLFSAASPLQGGRGHINEQWPAYWIARFDARGYVPLDCLRPRLWRNDRIRWWYAQNMLLFVERKHLERYPVLKKAAETSDWGGAPLVHPAKLREVADPTQVSARRALQLLRDTLRHRIVSH